MLARERTKMAVTKTPVLPFDKKNERRGGGETGATRDVHDLKAAADDLAKVSVVVQRVPFACREQTRGARARGPSNTDGEKINQNLTKIE